MNPTHYEHAFEGLLIQLLVVGVAQAILWALGLPGAGLVSTLIWWLAAACAWWAFLFRETAQREFELRRALGLQYVGQLKPWRAFDIWAWKLDAQLDLFFPIMVTSLAALLATHWPALRGLTR